MTQLVLCLLNPGAMGSAIGAVARRTGHRVLWVEKGRGSATRARAERAGMEAVACLADALAQADVVLSICPPHAATDVAREVAQTGFSGVYCDANAVSPDTVRRVAAIVTETGARFVDGGIIGSPPRDGSRVRLCLSGPDALAIAKIFADSAVETVLLGERIGAASAMKICYAAWTKGSTALLQAICAVAEQESVLGPLQAEWAQSQPELRTRLAQSQSSVGNAWRWKGEMEEVAQLFETCSLPGGFHHAAAEVFGRLDGFKGRPAVPLEDVVAKLLGSRAQTGSRRW